MTALSLEDYDAAATRFRTALAIGGAVILLLVAVVLWILTGRLARPVTRMAEVANRIASGHLDEPVGKPSGARETADLAIDLDRMLARLRSALMDANQSRDRTERLLADMAHEIRTPLTALKGYSDLYAKGMLAETKDVDRAMARIGDESQRLTELANEMLRLARNDEEPGEAEAVDVSRLVGRLAEDMQAAYPAHSIEAVLSDGDHMVLGIPGKLYQALVNLGSNACNHSPEDLPVSIAVAWESENVVVRVVDRGPGVDPEDRAELFSPFYRSDSARHRSGQHGAGLGLALVRQLVEEHSGIVQIEDTAGGGATFAVRLPAMASEPLADTGA